jgi:tRNA splicing endonuclease
MTDFNQKYLKYKNKYISLKEQIGGNNKPVMIYYDDTDKLLDFFKEIKEKYKQNVKESLSINNKNNISKSIYTIKIKDINGIPNLYTYEYGSHEVKPLFFWHLNGINTDAKLGSNFTIKETENANKFKQFSIYKIDKTNENEMITSINPDYQKSEALKLMKRVNEVTNNASYRRENFKNFLNMYEFYQENVKSKFATEFSDRFGNFLKNSNKQNPIGTSGTINVDYESKNNIITIGEDFKFNPVNNMILVQMLPKSKNGDINFKILSIFEQLDINVTNDQT